MVRMKYRNGSLHAVSVFGWITSAAHDQRATVHGLWLVVDGAPPGWSNQWNSDEDMPVGFFRVIDTKYRRFSYDRINITFITGSGVLKETQ